MSQIAALFDIDGTLTTVNIWKGIMAYGQQRRERRLTHAVFWLAHYPLLVPRALGLLREADFRRTWTSHLPWYFRGYTVAQMQAMSEWLAREFVAPVARADVLARLKQHRQNGDCVALVSGAPLPIVEALARMWQAPHAIGSPVELKDGRYTARMPGAPCIDEHKAAYVRQHFAARHLDVDFPASYAYADSYSDLGLFEIVGHPVAVYPDKKLRATAEGRGWAILGG